MKRVEGANGYIMKIGKDKENLKETIRSETGRIEIDKNKLTCGPNYYVIASMFNTCTSDFFC